MSIEKTAIDKICRILDDPADTFPLLTGAAEINDKESQAVSFAIDGKQVKEIGEIMGVSMHTAGSYIKGVTRKTGLQKADFSPYIIEQVRDLLEAYHNGQMQIPIDTISADILDAVKELGPHRVIVDDEGSAISYRRALAKHIVPTVIFIRDDGWSLGAPDRLVKVARETYPDAWIAVLFVATGQVVDYSTWRAAMESPHSDSA